MVGFKPDAPAPCALKTGDVLLFSGRGSVSASIKWATQSRWTHIGLVVESPEHGGVCLWESTRDANLPDLDSGVARQGVQLVPAHHRVNEYDGRIALRRLDGVRFGASELDAFAALRRQLAGRPYQSSKRELMAAGYARFKTRLHTLEPLLADWAPRRSQAGCGVCGGRTSPVPTERYLRARRPLGIFCSELVAQAYQALGLLCADSAHRPAHKYTPADFSERGEHLPWLRGALGPEIRLKDWRRFMR